VREKGIPFAAVTARATGLTIPEFTLLQKAVVNLRNNLMTASKTA
jgi:hypothetical protein